MRAVLSAVLAVMTLPTGAAASALEPLASADEYLYTCALGDATVGVSYHARSLPTPRGGFILPMALVFELGVFPQAEKWVRFAENQFSLAWEKSSGPRPSMSAAMLAAWLRHPDWVYHSQPRLEASAGSVGRDGGFDGVTIGGPPGNPRFPGDNRAPQRLPGPVEQPSPSRQDTGLGPEPPELVTTFALAATESNTPFAGYIFFEYDGKLKKLAGLTLSQRHEGARCTLAIDPAKALLPTAPRN